MLESVLLMFSIGLLLGIQHAFEPDHLVAVSVFAVQSKSWRSAAWLGISWGLGHTATLTLVGGAILLSGITIPESLSVFFELMVAVLLIFIGLHMIYRIWKTRVHFHQHEHDGGTTHSHFHTHEHKAEHTHNHTTSWRGFLFGLVHGVAGSSAAVLLVLSLISETWKGFLLIALFGVGSIGGMLLMTWIIGGITARVQENWLERIQLLAGGISVGFGILIGIPLLQAFF